MSPTLADKSSTGTGPEPVETHWTHKNMSKPANTTPSEAEQHLESRLGPTKGIIVLGDPSCGLTPIEAFALQGCGFQAFLWQATEQTILVAGVYLRTNESIQSETNATIISKLLAVLQATSHPYIVIGDWQNKPSAISTTVLPSKFHFDILAPDVSMLSGNVIDFSLVHTSLSGTTALTTEWAVPWRPHALLTLHLDIEAATKEYRQVVPDIDFRPWTTFQSQAFEVNEKTQQWADWISITEQYLLRGNLRLTIKPLTTPKPGGNWKKGKAAFWEQLQARFRLAQQQPATQAGGPAKGSMAAIKTIQNQWMGPPTWGQFLDTRHHWHHFRDEHAAELIQHTIQHQLQEAQQAAHDEAHLQYKTWLTQGHAEIPWKRPYRNLEPEHRMTQRFADWSAVGHQAGQPAGPESSTGTKA